MSFAFRLPWSRFLFLGLLSHAFWVEIAVADTMPPRVIEKHGIEFVPIPAGQFFMGTPPEDRKRLEERGWWNRFLQTELPAHRVIISKPFLMGITEVTQGQWKHILGNPHEACAFRDDDRPVDSVSRYDAVRFIKRLNERGPDKFRLPTEAEWEYCCRAGSWGLFMTAETGQVMNEKDLAEFSWFKGNAKGKTQLVGQKRSNAWGLRDMLGNVWEWCDDFYDREFYLELESPAIDPRNQRRFSERVIRGGSWYLPAAYQRAAARGGFAEEKRSPYVGFRLVCEPADASQNIEATSRAK